MKKEQKLIFRLLPLLIAAVIAALLPQMIRNEYPHDRRADSEREHLV